MKQLIAKIAENKKVAENFYKIRIESAYLAKNSEPGQFVEVKVSDGIEPLLRRPLGVHRISKPGIELLYEVVGKGTEILSHRKAGEMLDVIGPLGTGFDLSRQTGKPANRQTILVAGGIGVAPLLALAESLTFSVERIAYRKRSKIQVFIGAKTKNHIICSNDFKKLGCEVRITTDDGSKGHKGFVSELLESFLNAKRYPLNAMIYACGPVGMLKAVARIAHDAGAKCQVSLEERMACGVGVCLGCPVKIKTLHASVRSEAEPPRRGRFTNDEYKMVCKDGPVFNAEEIIW